MQKILETWRATPEGSTIFPELFFKKVYGFELDRSNGTHAQHLSVIREFLGQRVGKDAYLESSRADSGYVKCNLKKMTTFQKIGHVLNENIDSALTVTKTQELILELFDCIVHRTMVSECLRLLCECTALVSRENKKSPGPGGGQYHYTFSGRLSNTEVEAVSKIYYRGREKYKTKTRDPNKVFKRKKVESVNVEEIQIFKPEDFVRVNDEVIAKISYEDAQKLTTLYNNIVTDLEVSRVELQKSKKHVAELIDENQRINIELRIIKDGKITSMDNTISSIRQRLEM